MWTSTVCADVWMCGRSERECDGTAGGVLTPAAALGDDLWARLESAKWDAADEAPAVTVEHD